MSYKKELLFLFVVSILWSGCQNDEQIPDVSAIELNTEIRRFEQDLFQLDTNNIETELKDLEVKYPYF